MATLFSTSAFVHHELLVRIHSIYQPDGVDTRIPVYRLNLHFQFHDVFTSRNSYQLGSLIRNPEALVIDWRLDELITWFKFFSLKDLRRLADVHTISYRTQTKEQLSGLLMQHTCRPLCGNTHIIVFKSLSCPRTASISVSPTSIPQLPTATQNNNRFPLYAPHPSNAQTPSQTQNSSGAEIPSTALSDERGTVVDSPHLHVRTTETPELDHLKLLTDEEKLKILLDWETEISTTTLKSVVCASCGCRTLQADTQWVPGTEINLDLLTNPELPDALLPREYSIEAYGRSILSFKGLRQLDRLGDIRLCTNCHQSLKKAKMPKFALANHLYSARSALPQPVKDAFELSTILDWKLICRARSSNICCRFSAGEQNHIHSTTSILSQARRGIRGNVMVVPLDAVRMNQVIPPPASEIRDTICAVFVGPQMPTRRQLLGSKYSPILVRRSRVKTMLQFLLDCNPFYNIHGGRFNVNQENLDNLFAPNTDEDVPHCVEIGHIASSDTIEVSTAEYAPRGDPEDILDEGSEILLENVGYTDGDRSASNYLAMKALALERCRRGMPFLMAGTQTGVVSDFNNPAILTCLFPHLDPWGIIGFAHPCRRVKITMEDQLRHLLRLDDDTFERDPEFAFVFYNVVRKMEVSRSIRFSVSPRIHRQLSTSLMTIDPDVLSSLGKKFDANPNYKPMEGAERAAANTMSAITMVARHIQGSNGHKVLMRNQIRALINHQGPPTLFLTLNPSDVDNPVVRLLAGHDIVLEDIERGEDMKSWDRRLFAARHPATCALFFHIIITKFISIGLGYDEKHRRSGLFGTCDAYYGTVEAQGKGTLHCHLLIWLRGHLSPSKLREKMAESNEYRDRVFRWVESIIKCEFHRPTTSASPSVFDLQPRERIKNRDIGNPHPGTIPAPSAHLTDNRTQREFWTEYHAFIEQLLHAYNWHVHGSTCWKYLRRGEARNDASCRLRMNGLTWEYTTTDEESGALQLRRHHPKIAAYNDALIFMLKCNTELKFIGSGRAARDLVFYITDYVTKPSLPVHAGMAALQYAVQKIGKSLAHTSQGLTPRLEASAVIIAVNSMMGRHEISHQQVMSYLVGGGDHYKSHKFAVLNWSAILAYVDNWYQTQRPRPFDLNETSALFNPSMNMDLDIRQDSVTVSSQQLDYVYRSEQAAFDSLNVYDFVAFTIKSLIPTKKRISRQVEDINGSFCSWNHPQRSTHYLALRQEEHVPVLLGPSIPNPARSSEVREKWAKNILVLFKPWRVLDDLIGNYETWLDAYEAHQHNLSARHQAIINNMNAFSESVDARGEAPYRSPRSRGDDPSPTFDSSSLNIDRDHELDSDDLHGVVPDESPDQNDDNTAHIDDVFVCVDDNSRHEHHLDNVLIQRVGPEIVPSLDRCHAPDIDSMFVFHPRIDCAFEVGLNDLPQITKHQVYMKEKKKNGVGDGATESDNEDENDDSTTRHIPYRFFQQRCEMVDIITLPGHRAGDLTAQEVSLIRETVNSIISRMNLASNPEQLRAFTIISNHFVEGKAEQLLMYVSGVGGTGKSHVIKAVVALFEAFECRDSLLLGAPTGIAAVLIGGYTLHSLALLGPNGKGSNTERLARIWKGVKFLIIDEVSMVGAKFLSQFSNRLRKAKSGHGVSIAAPFGGVNVIFMGDFGQLKPPIQHSLYAHVITQSPSFLTATSVDGIDSTNGILLWRQVKIVVELTKNQRQASDPQFADFLLRLRRGECLHPRQNPSTKCDWEYLQQRVLNQLDGDTLRSFRDAPIVVGSKTVRDALNAKLIKYHARRTNQEVGIYHSVDTISRANVPIGIRNRLWSIPSSSNNESFGHLPIFSGMKVMITENIAFLNGIVNGSEGTIHSIHYTGCKVPYFSQKYHEIMLR